MRRRLRRKRRRKRKLRKRKEIQETAEVKKCSDGNECVGRRNKTVFKSTSIPCRFDPFCNVQGQL